MSDWEDEIGDGWFDEFSNIWADTLVVAPIDYEDGFGPFVVPPAGASAAGLFNIPGIPSGLVGPPGILADKIDYGQNNEQLDRATFEYLSLLEGMDPIDEQVMIALSRVRKSGAAVQNTGSDFFGASPKITEGTPAAVRNEARNGLKLLLDRRDISVESVDVTPDDATNSFVVEVGFRNLRAKDRDKVRTARTTVAPAG